MGLLACSLLIVNNLRDIPTDAESGKHTLAVRLGDGRARHGSTSALLASPGLLVASVAGRLALAVAFFGFDCAAGDRRAGDHASCAAGPWSCDLIAVLGATRPGHGLGLFGAFFVAGIALGG